MWRQKVFQDMSHIVLRGVPRPAGNIAKSSLEFNIMNSFVFPAGPNPRGNFWPSKLRILRPDWVELRLGAVSGSSAPRRARKVALGHCSQVTGMIPVWVFRSLLTYTADYRRSGLDVSGSPILIVILNKIFQCIDLSWLISKKRDTLSG